MDITPQDSTQQPMSDDQELAKALAGVMPDAPEEAPTPTTDNGTVAPAMQFEENAVATSTPSPDPTPDPVETPVATADPTASLDAIKKDALGELRPLIDHVDLPPEERFDTYLMLIRSTDDTSLISPAHVAAQAITDEKRRAEALLDIIKEIDYLSRTNQTPAI
ncbi:MAG: hypothetical protein WA030_03270 [Candidatus Microsaccharimonas sp.]